MDVVAQDRVDLLAPVVRLVREPREFLRVRDHVVRLAADAVHGGSRRGAVPVPRDDGVRAGRLEREPAVPRVELLAGALAREDRVMAGAVAPPPAARARQARVRVELLNERLRLHLRRGPAVHVRDRARARQRADGVHRVRDRDARVVVAVVDAAVRGVRGHAGDPVVGSGDGAADHPVGVRSDELRDRRAVQVARDAAHVGVPRGAHLEALAKLQQGVVVLEAAGVVAVAGDAADPDAVGGRVGQGERVHVQFGVRGVHGRAVGVARKPADVDAAEVGALHHECVQGRLALLYPAVGKVAGDAARVQGRRTAVGRRQHGLAAEPAVLYGAAAGRGDPAEVEGAAGRLVEDGRGRFRDAVPDRAAVRVHDPAHAVAGGDNARARAAVYRAAVRVRYPVVPGRAVLDRAVVAVRKAALLVHPVVRFRAAVDHAAVLAHPRVNVAPLQRQVLHHEPRARVVHQPARGVQAVDRVACAVKRTVEGGVVVEPYRGPLEKARLRLVRHEVDVSAEYRVDVAAAVVRLVREPRKLLRARDHVVGLAADAVHRGLRCGAVPISSKCSTA